MKPFILFGFLILATFSNANKEQERSVKLTNSINSFSGAFYKQTALKQSGKNLIMSPLSAHVLLSLMSTGARGDTKKELQDTLQLEDDQFTKDAYKPAMKRLNNLDGVTLKTANKIYVTDSHGYDLHPDFKSVAVDHFYAETDNLNFGNKQQAANTINSWVEDKTNKKIKNLISPDSLNANTHMVLVNAIYFQGPWKYQFETHHTSKKDFYLNKANKIKVDMMYQKKAFKYGALPEMDARIIELPFTKGSASMYIILPNEIDGLHLIEEKIPTIRNMVEISGKMSSVSVKLSLPKFELSSSIDLKQVLPGVGIRKIFGNCDLGGMMKTPISLSVTEAFQKAFIRVEEGGCEAAAATYFAVGRMAIAPGRELSEVFKVDRPFYFMIVNNQDNSMLFVGSVKHF